MGSCALDTMSTLLRFIKNPSFHAVPGCRSYCKYDLAQRANTVRRLIGLLHDPQKHWHTAVGPPPSVIPLEIWMQSHTTPSGNSRDPSSRNTCNMRTEMFLALFSVMAETLKRNLMVTSGSLTYCILWSRMDPEDEQPGSTQPPAEKSPRRVLSGEDQGASQWNTVVLAQKKLYVHWLDDYSELKKWKPRETVISVSVGQAGGVQRRLCLILYLLLRLILVIQKYNLYMVGRPTVCNNNKNKQRQLRKLNTGWVLHCIKELLIILLVRTTVLGYVSKQVLIW